MSTAGNPISLSAGNPILTRRTMLILPTLLGLLGSLKVILQLAAQLSSLGLGSHGMFHGLGEGESWLKV